MQRLQLPQLPSTKKVILHNPKTQREIEGGVKLTPVPHIHKTSFNPFTTKINL